MQVLNLTTKSRRTSSNGNLPRPNGDLCRGPMEPDWINPNVRPMRCSYKYVSVIFEVWGLQNRVEDHVQRVIKLSDGGVEQRYRRDEGI